MKPASSIIRRASSTLHCHWPIASTSPDRPHLSACLSIVSTSRPSGRRTRCISRSAFGGSGTNFRQLRRADDAEAAVLPGQRHGIAQDDLGRPRGDAVGEALASHAHLDLRGVQAGDVADVRRPARPAAAADPQPTSSRSSSGLEVQLPGHHRVEPPHHASASAGRPPTRAHRAAPRRTGTRTTCADPSRCPLSRSSGRSRQWLGAVPAAGAWAARQSLPHGSGARIRTSDQAVNSRPLYH